MTFVSTYAYAYYTTITATYTLNVCVQSDSTEIRIAASQILTIAENYFSTCVKFVGSSYKNNLLAYIAIEGDRGCNYQDFTVSHLCMRSYM